MNGNDAAQTTSAVGELAALIAGLEDKLAGWAESASCWLDSQGKVTGTAVDKFIRPAVEAFLHEPGSLLAGAGFVAAAGLLGAERSYIAWWQGEDMERVDALANFSPQSMSRYVKAEWFKVPMATGLPHVTGPYIDLLCTDEYVLTFTHPIVKDGVLAGVVGMDVTAQMLERTALHILREIAPHAVLVNAEGRSIVCAGADVDAGDVVSLADGAQEFPVGRQFRILSATA
ncbi:cache domain-containing protein [Arthrobacter sp. LAPM80]|uniref:cache domain-containing protein n=1 Tax=Arthrobacter sp. LAPM80 TaxID=3141788 RepID=UPI00398A9E9A